MIYFIRLYERNESFLRVFSWVFSTCVNWQYMKKHKLTLRYLATNISIIIGIVLVWRGIWYVLDELDKWIFGGGHIWSALGGIVFGLIILYLPDKDFKEIEKL